MGSRMAYAYYLGNGRNLKLDAFCFRDELERLHETLHQQNYLILCTYIQCRAFRGKASQSELLPVQQGRRTVEREKADAAEAAYHKAMRELALRYTDVLDQNYHSAWRPKFSGKGVSGAAADVAASAVWNGMQTRTAVCSAKGYRSIFMDHFCSCDADWTPPRWEYDPDQRKERFKGGRSILRPEAIQCCLLDFPIFSLIGM